MDRCYFIDYEVWSEGLPVSWGNLALTIPIDRDGMNPAQLLAIAREHAARERLASPQEIRVRYLTLL